MNTVHATLLFVRDGSNILLAKKTRKMGIGLWNGYGGKVEGNDSFRKTMCKEFEIESGGATIQGKYLRKCAVIGFFFHDNFSDVPNFTVLVYTIYHDYMHGRVKTTEEMKDPRWFNEDDIPYDEMLPADRVFLPRVLEGEIFTTNFRFNDQEKTSAKEFGYRTAVMEEFPV